MRDDAPDNLVKFPRKPRLVRSAIPAPPAGFGDPDLLIQAGCNVAFIGLCIERLAGDLEHTPGLALRPDLVPWLHDVAGRFHYRAAQMELDARDPEGFGDVA